MKTKTSKYGPTGSKGKSFRGKGKSKATSSSQAASAAESVKTETPTAEDIGFDLDLELSTVDPTPAQFPQYTALAKAHGEDGKPMSTDELNSLQNEIEQMLTTTVARHGALLHEVDVLSGGAGSRKRSAVATQVKDEVKTEEEEAEETQTQTIPVKMRGSRSSASSAAANAARRQYPCYFPSNDFPDRFWQYVDQYCRHCTHADVAFLKRLVEEHSDKSLLSFFKACSSGKKTDTTTTTTQQNGVAKTSPSKQQRKRHATTSPTKGASPTRKRARRSATLNGQPGTSNGVLGGHTEALVQALVDESPRTLNGDVSSHRSSSRRHSLAASENSAAELSAIEQKVKRELEACGLLESEADTDSEVDSGTLDEYWEEAIDGDDEVSEELRRRQKELRDLQARLLPTLTTLLSLARSDVERANHTTELSDVDAQIHDWCNKLCNAHPRRKASAKEKEIVQKLVSRRTEVVEKIDSLPYHMEKS